MSSSPEDRRFRHPLWKEDLFFSSLKQVYETSKSTWKQALLECPLIKGDFKAYLAFQSQLVWEALCPANYPWLNPEVWECTWASKGENWRRSLAHLLQDQGSGGFKVPLASKSSHQVGKTLATTPGVVIARTPLFELLYYPPLKEGSFSPVLIIPSWINKFYILDLDPESSFIRWAGSQGIPIFVISWLNPQDIRHDVGLNHYIHCVLEAFLWVDELKGTPHLLGYCAGGNLMACAASWLESQGKHPASCTYMTSVFDFTQMGDARFYLESFRGQEELIKGEDVRLLFLSLRSKDTFWPFFIDHYYLGKEGSDLPIFYWNDDPMNIFPRLHQEFVDLFCRRNALIQGLSFGGNQQKLAPSRVPCFILGAQRDHISPWPSCYAGVGFVQGPCEFILVESGHVAGVINPPSSQKYGFFSGGVKSTAEVWRQTSDYSKGSWWPYWAKWIRSYSLIGEKTPWKGGLPCLGKAPGRYVLQRCKD